ncbi:MAG: response regulator [Desulfobacteraceae bacterium]|nr:response regulator [Desulfobacteraceae bacterium]
MKKLAFNSIRSNLTFWFVILGLTPLFLGIGITYKQQVRSLKQDAFAKLVAIRDLKVKELELWLTERTGDLKIISFDNELVDLEKIVFKEEKDQKDLKAYGNITRLLSRYLKNYGAYNELFIINPRTGVVEISTNRNSRGMDKSDDSYFTQPMQTRGLFIKDVYSSKAIARNSMTFSIPIFCSQHDQQHILGILVARVDLKHSLYVLLQNRIGLGKTGETLIVNKDLIALNELRWQGNAPLNFEIQADPAVNAAQGRTGIIESMDYRGENVLAAYAHIPRTGWGFVAKQDLAELYAPIHYMVVNLIVLILVALMAIIVVSFLTARALASPIIEMASTAVKMQKGDFSARNHISGSDELASLGETFNSMTESIESLVELQEINEDITETIIGVNDLGAFRTALLKKLVEVTNSQLGAYFLLNKKTGMFEPFFSLGVIPGELKAFDASALEGELGMVAETGKITRITDIPEESIFKFRTFTGTIMPKEIISLPIVIDNVVLGIVSLASIKPYPKKVLDLMEQPWAMGLSTVFANLLANEEVARLAGELQEANQGLQARTDELQSQSVELQCQAEELQQTAGELQEQNRELEAQRLQVEEANRLKSEFLSNMSHELRTPLNSVMALSRVLLMQAKDKLSEEEASYLEIIERNGRNLLALINDILDLSKIEAGRMDVSPKNFSVVSTIETIMERLEPLAEDKGIEVNLKIPDNFPQIESDENRVHQILQNLIGNAVKFTEQGGVIVSAGSDAENIHIEVSDTGIGISKKDLPHIFEEFRQVDGSSSRPYEGTGLGLTIAGKAVTMLGGNISVESTLGKGSTFFLTLPVRWQGMAPVSELAIFRPFEGAVPAQKTVLVVDDEPETLTMIASYLSGEGYNILRATSGEEAIRLARRHRPFAVTLDILMPEMDGWEVLQQLKQSPDTKDIPVIIVSLSDDKSTGIALGAVGYVSKPIKRDMLIGEINRIGGPSPYSIVVADDNESELREMARAIELEGMRPIVAGDGRICMELLKESVPDVLVLDLIMPEKNGFEVLDKVRSNPKTRELPVIVVTAKDLTREEKKKLSGNASSILAKSDTNPAVILEEIKNVFAGIERRGEGAMERGREVTDRILLVEDSEAAVIQVKTVLEDAGYTVDVARGGQEALDYMSRSIPGGIVLDLMMPEVDGFQVLNKMRSTEATAGIPVLVLTARDLTPEDLSKLSSNNIQQLIQKGDVDRELLLFKIRLMLGAGTGAELETVKHPAEQLESCIPQPERCNRQRSEGNGTPATILVVEDHSDNMTTIKAVLQNKYNILEAMDGEEGLRKIRTEHPDLVLLDMSLPVMDGYTVAGKAKRDQNVSHIPVVALTARAMKGDREEIINAGCDDYIAKPIDPELILQKVNDWLKG